MFKRFRKSKISKEVKEFRLASKLVKKLFSLHITKILIILLLLLIISPFVVFYFFKPRVHSDINYGVTFSKKYARELGMDWKDVYIKVLDDLNVKNMRLVVYWDEVEAEKDTYNYDDIKWQLDEAQKRDVNVILAMGRKVPRFPECFEPEWWQELNDDQLMEIELLEYVKNTTLTLMDYDAIKIWQVENEPFFKFGTCEPDLNKKTIKKEVQIVQTLDDRPILIQDSGEGGFWFPSYQLGNYLGISMYRRIWYDFWHIFLGNFIYFKYPLAHWTYKIKADLTLVPHDRIIVTELQAEPWGPGINSSLSQTEKDKTMSRHHFMETITYAQKAGFRDLYFWGVEWWLWEKEINNNPFYWNTAKALFN